MQNRFARTFSVNANRAGSPRRNSNLRAISAQVV